MHREETPTVGRWVDLAVLFLGRKKKDLKGTTTELLSLHTVEPPGGVASNQMLGGPERRRGKNSYGQFQISKWDKFRRILMCFACFCRTNSYGNFSYGQFHMHPKNLPRTYSEWLFHMDKFIRNIFVSKFVLTKNLAVYICPGHQRPSEWILSMKSGSINMSLSCCDKFGLIRKFSCFKLGQFQLL